MTEQQVRAEARPGGRCAFCHAAIEGADVVTCVCGAMQHPACVREGGARCTTVGCPGLPDVLAARDVGAADQVKVLHEASPPPASDPPVVAPWIALAAALPLVHVVPWLAPLVAVVIVPWLLARAVGGRSLVVLGFVSALLQAGVVLSLDLPALRAHPGALDLYVLAPALCALSAALAPLLVRRRARWDDPRRPALMPVVLLLVLFGVAGRWSALRQLGLDLRAEWRERGDLAELDALVYDLTDPDDAVRRAAERAQRDFDRADAIPLLVELLRHPDGYTRHGAALALAMNRARDPAAVPPLVEALEGPEPTVHDAAAVALLRYARELPAACRPAVPALVRALESDDAWVRMHAVEALGHLREAAAVPLLIERLDDPSTGTRSIAPGNWQHVADEAEAALVRVGAPAVEALRRAASSHPRPAVQAAARRVLERITGERQPER